MPLTRLVSRGLSVSGQRVNKQRHDGAITIARHVDKDRVARLHSPSAHRHFTFGGGIGSQCFGG